MSEYLERGNKLWEGSRMFLPEHKAALLQRKEDLKKIPKPILDDQAWIEIEITIHEAIEYGQNLIIKYWQDGFIKEIRGYVHRIDTHSKQVVIVDSADERHRLKLDCIFAVK